MLLSGENEARDDGTFRALTLTEPVGVPVPVTLKLTVTACATSEGLGEVAVIAVVLAAFCAVTV